MPLPTPNSDESQDEFISRCMMDETAVDDFPDEDQRLAVCFRQWRENRSADNRDPTMMEVKYIDRPLEVKELDEAGVFTGYASVFGIEDSYKEIVAPGAFKRSLQAWKRKGRLPKMLWQHDPGQPIGYYNEMAEDNNGLFVKGQLLKDDVTQAREAYAMLKHGVLDGLSIGFQTRSDSWDDKTGIRTLTQVDLWEVSLVTFPANEEALVAGVKSTLAAGEIPSIREFEKYLRESGFSRQQALLIAGKGYRAICQSESDDDAEIELASRVLALVKSLGAQKHV